jgi:hypothetical protein
MKYCRYCGGEVSDTAKACGHCGRWLAGEPAMPPSTAAPEEREHVGPEAVAPPAVEAVFPEPKEPAPTPLAARPEMEHGVRRPAAVEVVECQAPAEPPDELPSARAREVQPAAAVPPAQVRPPETREVKEEPPLPPRGSAVAHEPAKPVSPLAPPPAKVRRRIPAWVWGLGAVAIILIAGAALVASGALTLPSQQMAAPRATVTPAATRRATREPASVPAPAVEPLTIHLGTEDVWQTVDADQPVFVEWVWGVCDPALIADNLDALDFKVTVDGKVTAMGNMAEYRTDLREEESSGVHAWWQHYSYRLDSFRSGSAHWLDLERRFSRRVTDGCDLDGDGEVDWYGPGSVRSSSLHLVVR